ncbi:hypothetical protein BKA93DRAFT_744671, partial [Sparassis latifolia]
IMRKTHTVISDIATLHYIDRTACWQPPRLDLYSPYTKFSIIVDYLITKEFACITDAYAYPRPHLTGVQETTELRTPQATILVHRSIAESPLYPILYLRSTILMNFLSADCIGIAYPALTLKKCGILNIHWDDPKHDEH